MGKYIKDFATFHKNKYVEEFFENKQDSKSDKESKPRKQENRYRTCIVCGQPFVAHSGGRKTCSDDCMKYYKEHRKEYLSDETIEKLRWAGLKSSNIQSEKRRSKNEIYFYELCKNEYDNVTHNQNIFNGWDADVLIYDFKIAILWNGNWHYKEIKKGSSLNQIQNRDRIKVKEIEESGWIPYTIKDEGKYKKSFVEEQFKKLKEFIESIKDNMPV